MDALDSLNNRYGRDTVRLGSAGTTATWSMEAGTRHLATQQDGTNYQQQEPTEQSKENYYAICKSCKSSA